MVCCVISHLWIFYKGMLECLEEMLTRLKMEVRAGTEDFHEKKTFVTICFCMKREDVLEVLMFMPKNFVDEFILIWGHE